jgi:teichuronic acid biosynthesis glycosyltransferase TuaG
MNSLVSVMMPAKNTEKFIEQAIHSILKQTYKNWELVIVDDKSTDNTKELAISFTKKDSRIKVFDGNDAGVANSRNKIIDLSHGDYIMLQDSDDASDCHRMESLVNEAVKHNKSYISSNIYLTNINFDTVQISKKPESNKEIRAGLRRFYNRETIYPQASLAHRSIYTENRYHEYIKVMSDWDLVSRISEDPEVHFHNVQEPLYYYRLNEGSMTLKQKTRIPYNLLMRYNEILRRKNKKELTSLKDFEDLINNKLSFKILYNFFFLLKDIQYKVKFRKYS